MHPEEPRFEMWNGNPCTRTGNPIGEHGRRRVTFVANYTQQLEIGVAADTTSVTGTGVEAWAIVMNRRGNGGDSAATAQSFAIGRRAVDAIVMYYRRNGNSAEIDAKIEQVNS